MFYSEKNISYRSAGMMVLAIMFLILFTAGIAYMILLATHILDGPPGVFLWVALGTLLAGLATWNMEVRIEMRPEGLHFDHLIKPGYTIAYNRIQRISVRMLRGMYYCFMRYGSGLFGGTFFPVGYWTSGDREETTVFLEELARWAGLVQVGKTPLGAPIYERREVAR